MRPFLFFHFHGNLPKKGPKKILWGTLCEKNKFPKNNDMYIELYVYWPGKSEFNVGTTIGRTIFLKKGRFMTQKGPFWYIRLHISIWVSKYRFIDPLCPFFASLICFEWPLTWCEYFRGPSPIYLAARICYNTGSFMIMIKSSENSQLWLRPNHF